EVLLVEEGARHGDLPWVDAEGQQRLPDFLRHLRVGERVTYAGPSQAERFAEGPEDNGVRVAGNELHEVSACELGVRLVDDDQGLVGARRDQFLYLCCAEEVAGWSCRVSQEQDSRPSRHGG